MKRILGSSTLLAVVAAVLIAPAPAAGQENYTFTVGALGGVGGSLDAENGDSLGNTSLQLNLTAVTEPQTHVGLRLGQIDLGIDGGFTDLLDAELSYLTIGGEYRFDHQYYESGMYLALGAYRLEGIRIPVPGALASSEEETTIGLSIGTTGEFALTRSFGLIFELAGHYITFDDAQIFVVAHAGIAFHF